MIRSKPASQEYRDNYDRVFGKKEEKKPIERDQEASKKEPQNDGDPTDVR